MIKVTEQELKAMPSKNKRKTPLTKLRQFFFINKDNPEGIWITESVNFVTVKEGSNV